MNTSHVKTESRAPLFIIIALILLPVAVLSFVSYGSQTFSLVRMLEQSCAGFFLVFSGAKLLDLPGFAKGFATYDLLAMRSKIYAVVYPFIELTLGILYLVGNMPVWLDIVTLVVMLWGALGVGRSLLLKKKVQCACLGTVINVPLTTITLWENILMAMMALLMIIL